MGRRKIDSRIPRYQNLIDVTFQVLKMLGGSGTVQEITNKTVELLNLSDDIVDFPHSDSGNQSELEYQLAWARTYLKNSKVIMNSERGVWSITSEYSGIDNIDVKTIIKKTLDKRSNKVQIKDATNEQQENLNDDNSDEVPEEIRPWRKRITDVLMNMDPYGFERLSQRLLRECGFSQVVVTKKSGDGGIDGTGKLRINGIFSFNVAFQCKRYKGVVGPGEIRDFRGSLTTDIEKGVFITTGTFSKAASEEASNPGKQQIDLIDGEDFINKLAEYEIGLREIKDYEIDEEFFKTI
ncbi:restriction endonuclease [Clostridium tyrobutyricum]|nr:restriction endonuclease [Clostridium tyrobutyricum]